MSQTSNHSVSQNQNNSRKKPPIVLLCGFSAALFLGSLLLGFIYYHQIIRVEQMQQTVNNPLIYSGISIGGMDFSGKSLEEAQQELVRWQEEQQQRYTFHLTIGNQEFSGEIPIQSDAAQVLESAYAYARDGELQERFEKVQSLLTQSIDFPLTISADEKAIEKVIDRAAAQVEIPAIDAAVSTFDISTKTFVFTSEQAGVSLDTESLRDQAAQALAQHAVPIQLTGQLTVVEPAVKRADLESSYRLLSSFSTKTTSNKARNTNIQLAIDAFHGKVLQPGETFSINEATGERTPAKGYRAAGAIKNGRLVPEPGGGVCQVSTTLFNTVVRAGLTIAERHNHSFPIDYVPRGHDAMINYPDSDLKFTNEGSGPVYLVAYFENRKLTMEVYGTPILEEGVTVDLRANTTQTLSKPAEISRYDSSQPVGTVIVDRKGRTGYRVNTYIQYRKGEELLSENLLFKSYYRPIAPIVIYGTYDAFSPVG